MKNFEITFTRAAWDGIYSANIVRAESAEIARAYYEQTEGTQVAGVSEFHGTPKPGQPITEVPSDWTPAPVEPEQKQPEAADILGEAVKLEHRVSIYVPGTVDTDKAADNRQQVERVAAEFSRMFGGATATTATGYWMSDTAGLVAESTTIVYAACTAEQLEKHLAEVVELARQIKREMRQEAVSLELDSCLYIL